MQFSDTSSSKNGLVQDCEIKVFGDNAYGKISGDANLLATFTRLMNQALNRVASLIMSSDARWQWDDNNNTDYPIATAALVADQQDYVFAVSHLKISRVELLDEAGNWKLLTPIDKDDVYNQSLTDFMSGSGVPKYYDKLANSVFLYPKPSYSQAASLKVYFQRPPSYFVVGDTTKVPGFNSLYHGLVSLIASRDYALDRSLKSAKGLAERVQQEEQDLIENYALRSHDEKLGVRARPKSFK